MSILKAKTARGLCLGLGIGYVCWASFMLVGILVGKHIEMQAGRSPDEFMPQMQWLLFSQWWMLAGGVLFVISWLFIRKSLQLGWWLNWTSTTVITGFAIYYAINITQVMVGDGTGPIPASTYTMIGATYLFLFAIWVMLPIMQAISLSKKAVLDTP